MQIQDMKFSKLGALCTWHRPASTMTRNWNWQRKWSTVSECKKP